MQNSGSDTLRLLSELKGTASAESEQAPATQSGNKPAPLAIKTAPQRTFACYTIGPFNELKAVRKLTAVFKALKVYNPRRRIETDKTVSGYRVYLGPFPSRDEAKKQLEQLKREGFKGSGLIFSGTYKNAISLGMFSNKFFAKRQRRRAEKLGYEVHINARTRSRSVYWLDYRDDLNQPIVEPLWSEILDDFPTVKKRTIDCKA
ncbi:MAG: SPOR domain-containing protein [Gammaproteobacteria bacterium]|nr:SPOR domain-containing protein [Gammaproteobacteria bacterium]